MWAPAACERWQLSADTWLLSQITLMTVVLYLHPAPAYPDEGHLQLVASGLPRDAHTYAAVSSSQSCPLPPLPAVRPGIPTGPSTLL
jgi:hypothetical protein